MEKILISLVVMLTLTVIALLLNLFAIFILSTSVNVKKSRFKSLVLQLSVSNIAIVTNLLLHIVFSLLDDPEENAYDYVCSILKFGTAAAVCFSLLQTLLICLERLNATFVNKKVWLHQLTSWRVVLGGYTLIHGIMIILIIFQFIEKTHTCTTYSLSTKYAIFIHLSGTALCVSIISTYVVVIIRIFKQKIKINTTVNSNTEKKNMRGKFVRLGLLLHIYQELS